MSGLWEEVLVTGDPLEAEMVRDVLESGGIPVVLESRRIGPYPVNVGRLGEVRVMVPASEVETARALLSEGCCADPGE